ncbi:MAG: beta-ketoacyl-[acyl-carrier-protein] synthase family protein [Planctomycetota bacterium]
MNRVVVTGVGVMSPVGSGREVFWGNLLAGRSGIAGITLFDASTFPVRIGGEVKDMDLARIVDEFPGAAGIRERKILFALGAARDAVEDSGIREGELKDAVLEVGVGQEVLHLEDVTPFAHDADPGGSSMRGLLADPTRRALQAPPDSATVILGGRYGLLGGRYTNCSACAAGAQVVGEAFHMLRDGEVEVALVGAADSPINPLGLGGFIVLRVLSEENDRPARACRPFDATRIGTVLGEGGAFLVLETMERARARGARAYAEVVGYGSSLDAFRVSEPDPNGRGAAESMRRAIEDAGLGATEVDCVNTHGTGTPKNDAVETAAIKEVLGKRAYEIPVHSVKSMTGHMIAACGAVEIIAGCLTLARGAVPPTINLERRDPRCDLDYVTEGARRFEGETVLSNSFGFGGQNATVVLRRFS